jgi:nucleotide-binding universal stress UspA family protein
MKTILIPTEQHELTASVLQTAALLARKLDGYMEGFALFPAMVEIYALDSEIPLPIEVREHDAEVAKQARSLFEKFMLEQGVAKAAEGQAGFSFGWLDDVPDGDAFVGSYGRLFDVIVLGRPEPRRGLRPSMATIEAALFEAGRAVLIAPATPPNQMGENILIAWNCSTEQARTTIIALPLLQQASRVVVATVQGGTVPGPTGEQLVRHLIHYGVSAQAITVSPGSRSIGEAILAAAASQGSDLLIKGAYTQSRLRQMIFGGATRHILASANIPVLMAR